VAQFDSVHLDSLDVDMRVAVSVMTVESLDLILHSFLLEFQLDFARFSYPV